MQVHGSWCWQFWVCKKTLLAQTIYANIGSKLREKKSYSLNFIVFWPIRFCYSQFGAVVRNQNRYFVTFHIQTYKIAGRNAKDINLLKYG